MGAESGKLTGASASRWLPSPEPPHFPLPPPSPFICIFHGNFVKGWVRVYASTAEKWLIRAPRALEWQAPGSLVTHPSAPAQRGSVAPETAVAVVTAP